jgi:CheY-like chemotaxis protein
MFGELVHTFETLLKEIQDNRLPWAATLAQTFIQGCDQLKTYREDLIDNRETSVDFTALMDSVKSFLPASHSSHASDRAQSIIPSFGLFDDDSTSSADVCDPNQNTEPPKASARSPADARPDEPTETPGGVLVVDDERHLREAFTEILTDLNRPIYPAANGQEALEIFQTETIDVIVSDYSMQPMNGIELIAKVRETEQMVPVIFLSAIAPMQELARFIELGTFAFLEKPCEAN